MAKKQVSQSTLPARWDEVLAKQAEAAAKMEQNTGGGQFFSIKSGILKWQDAPLPNNQMAVVILDHIFENVFYEGEFDANQVQAPTCFAFGREDTKLKPHDSVVERKDQQCGASGLCAGCPQNEFGTAEKGRGKACRNTRRLALIPAGDLAADGKFKLLEDIEHYQTTPVGYLRLPVTSVKGFAGFVKQVAGALKRPPAGIITKVRVVPDPKNQFAVLFEPIANLPDSLIGAVMKRREEVTPVIDFPYTPIEEVAERAQAGRQTNGGKGRQQKLGRRY